jgi:hypothetical protein
MDGPAEPPVNLAALDTLQDELRWRSVMNATMARVDTVLAARTRRDDPLDLIASWRRPLLAAAAIAVALLVPAEIALERREARMERVERLVEISSGWLDGRRPAGADFLRAVGASRNGAEPAP